MVDDEGRHCVVVRRPNGVDSGSCLEGREPLAVRKTDPDANGTIYVLGLTTEDAAVSVLATTKTSTVQIQLQPVDGWNEQAFAAPLSFVPATVQLLDANDAVLATENLG